MSASNDTVIGNKQELNRERNSKPNHRAHIINAAPTVHPITYIRILTFFVSCIYSLLTRISGRSGGLNPLNAFDCFVFSQVLAAWNVICRCAQRGTIRVSIIPWRCRIVTVVIQGSRPARPCSLVR